MRLTITRDDVSPGLRKLASAARRPLAVFQAMGNTFKSITEGNFNSAGARFRPRPWPALWDGRPSILQKSTTMAKSFRLEVTNTYARVSNPMVYAPVHQFGKVITASPGKRLSWVGANGKRVFARSVEIPARPFFPVVDGKLTVDAERLISRAGERALRRAQGRP